MSPLAARLDAALAAVQDGAASARVLIPLYQDAARHAQTDQQRGFFLTHAYVHALETGDARAESLRAQLRGMGREA